MNWIGRSGRAGKTQFHNLTISSRSHTHQRWCHLHEMNMFRSPQFNRFNQLTNAIHDDCCYYGPFMRTFSLLLFSVGAAKRAGKKSPEEVKNRTLSQMDSEAVPFASLKNIKFYLWIIIINSYTHLTAHTAVMCSRCVYCVCVCVCLLRGDGVQANNINYSRIYHYEYMVFLWLHPFWNTFFFFVEVAVSTHSHARVFLSFRWKACVRQRTIFFVFFFRWVNQKTEDELNCMRAVAVLCMSYLNVCSFLAAPHPFTFPISSSSVRFFLSAEPCHHRYDL